MLQDLNWETLESRRTKLQLAMMYKITIDLVDINCDAYLTSCKTQKPELKKTTSLNTVGPAKDNHQASTNYITDNLEAWHGTYLSRCLQKMMKTDFNFAYFMKMSICLEDNYYEVIEWKNTCSK